MCVKVINVSSVNAGSLIIIPEVVVDFNINWSLNPQSHKTETCFKGWFERALYAYL